MKTQTETQIDKDFRDISKIYGKNDIIDSFENSIFSGVNAFSVNSDFFLNVFHAIYHKSIKGDIDQLIKKFKKGIKGYDNPVSGSFNFIKHNNDFSNKEIINQVFNCLSGYYMEMGKINDDCTIPLEEVKKNRTEDKKVILEKLLFVFDRNILNIEDIDWEGGYNLAYLFVKMLKHKRGLDPLPQIIKKNFLRCLEDIEYDLSSIKNYSTMDELSFYLKALFEYGYEDIVMKECLDGVTTVIKYKIEEAKQNAKMSVKTLNSPVMFKNKIYDFFEVLIDKLSVEELYEWVFEDITHFYTFIMGGNYILGKSALFVYTLENIDTMYNWSCKAKSDLAEINSSAVLGHDRAEKYKKEFNEQLKKDIIFYGEPSVISESYLELQSIIEIYRESDFKLSDEASIQIPKKLPVTYYPLHESRGEVKLGINSMDILTDIETYRLMTQRLSKLDKVKGVARMYKSKYNELSTSLEQEKKMLAERIRREERDRASNDIINMERKLQSKEGEIDNLKSEIERLKSDYKELSITMESMEKENEEDNLENYDWVGILRDKMEEEGLSLIYIYDQEYRVERMKQQLPKITYVQKDNLMRTSQVPRGYVFLDYSIGHSVSFYLEGRNIPYKKIVKTYTNLRAKEMVGWLRNRE